MKSVLLEEVDVDLLFSLVSKHRQYVLSKMKLYDLCNEHGEYKSMIKEC